MEENLEKEAVKNGVDIFGAVNLALVVILHADIFLSYNVFVKPIFNSLPSISYFEFWGLFIFTFSMYLLFKGYSRRKMNKAKRLKIAIEQLVAAAVVLVICLVCRYYN